MNEYTLGKVKAFIGVIVIIISVFIIINGHGNLGLFGLLQQFLGLGLLLVLLFIYNKSHSK